MFFLIIWTISGYLFHKLIIEKSFYQIFRFKVLKLNPYVVLTFFENIFCKEKPIVDINADIKPIILKEISVIVAIPTPVIIGIKLKYTNVGCFSRNIKRVKITVNKGIVALTTIGYQRKIKQ